MTKPCPRCGAAVSKRSKSGLCRECASSFVNQRRAFRKNYAVFPSSGRPVDVFQRAKMNDGKHAAAGISRAMPSLPRLKCLEKAEE